MNRAYSTAALLRQIAACTLCAARLPLGPRPVLQYSTGAGILIAGQAPGKRVHQSGIPFDDASGARLRDWLGIERDEFYDPGKIAILPMAFCYPGTGKSGDLPPAPECAAAWRAELLAGMPQLQMTLVLGVYAQRYHLGADYGSVTECVAAWRDHWPGVVPLPHPSPRNNRWLRQNPWFEIELLPALRRQVAKVLRGETK